MSAIPYKAVLEASGFKFERTNDIGVGEFIKCLPSGDLIVKQYTSHCVV